MVINLKKYRWALLMIIIVTAVIIGQGLIRHRKQEISPVKPQTRETHGEFLAWKDVSRLFPKYAKAAVIDYDTKLKFKVQRRAGSLHADVQPLTAADSAIMKKIYQGRWSWKRRAVLVELKDGRKLAGSMHGMPHGQGAIKGNNFRGHFCIHFRDSKTHGSGKIDLAHQMMIWKAAGVFGDQVKRMSQKDGIKVFFTAIDQNDTNLAARMMIPTANSNRVLNYFKQLEAVKIESIALIAESKDNIYKVKLLTVPPGSNKQVSLYLLITAHGFGEGSLYNFKMMDSKWNYEVNWF